MKLCLSPFWSGYLSLLRARDCSVAEEYGEHVTQAVRTARTGGEKVQVNLG